MNHTQDDMESRYYKKNFMQKTSVYILKCADNSYYIGHTDNIKERLISHLTRANKDCYTANRLPVELIFVREFNTRDEAFIFERQIKKWSRKKKEALIIGDFEALKILAKRKK